MERVVVSPIYWLRIEQMDEHLNNKNLQILVLKILMLLNKLQLKHLRVSEQELMQLV